MTTNRTKMLAMAVVVLGIPMTAIADCESGESTVGFVDGNSVSENCVQPASMVETEPVAVVNPTADEEPNPNPNAGEGEEEGGGEE